MLSKHAHKTNLSWALPDLEAVNHCSVSQNTLISLSARLKTGLLNTVSTYFTPQLAQLLDTATVQIHA